MALNLQRPKDKRQPENTIALINIVFLMLIFFLVAGSLTPPLDQSISMITTSDATRAEPPDALNVTADGTMRYRGRDTTLEAFLATREQTEPREPMAESAPGLRLVVDRALPAGELVAITGRLRTEGIETVTVVTERAERPQTR